MKTLNKYVGMDVHKDTTMIAVAEGGWTGNSQQPIPAGSSSILMQVSVQPNLLSLNK